MSKYRIELTRSGCLVVLQLLTLLLLVLSIFTWQTDIFPFQMALQLALAVVVSVLIVRDMAKQFYQERPTIVFSERGDWLEIRQGSQSSWTIGHQSRVTSLVLFIRLASQVNQNNTKFILVFKDQLAEQYFRCLCRVIFFQQHSHQNNSKL